MTVNDELAASTLGDLLFDEPGLARCLVAPDRRVARANAEWLRATGRTRDQALGEDVLDLLPTPREAALAMQSARAGDRLAIPRHPRTVRGRRTWWEGSIAPVCMPGGTGLLVSLREVGGGADCTSGIATDVTERRRSDPEREELLRDLERRAAELERAQEELRRSETMLAQAGSMARLGAWWLEISNPDDLAANPLRWSDEVYRIFGYEPGAVEVSNALFFEHVHPEDRQAVSDAVAHALAARRPYTLEHRIVPRGGGERVVLERGDARYDDAGRPVLILGAVQDVTEQVRAREALRLGEERLRAHIANSPLAVVGFDAGFRITRWSEEAERMFGWTAAEVLGRGIGELRWVYEEDLEAVRRESARLLSGGSARTLNVNRNYTKAGAVIHCEWYSSAIYDAQGRLISVLCQVLDVTARTRAEQALREREEQFRAAFETAELERRRLAAVLEALPAGVAISDATGRLTHFNAALVRIWGSPPIPDDPEEHREWRGRWADSGEPLAPGDWAMARALRTGQVVQGDVVEIERFDGSGRLTIIEAAAPIRDADGRTVGGVVAEVDITRQRRAEEALHENELRLRAALSAARMGTWRWDVRADRLVLDDGLEWLMGLGADRQVNDLDDFLRLVHPEDRAALRDAFLRSARQGLELDVEFRVVWADGGVRWLKDRGDVVEGPDGRPLHLTGACVDITDRKAMEEALREAGRRKDEFLATLSHELRNPLAPIRNGAYLLQHAAPGSEQATRAQEVIRRQTEHLTRLVDDLLDVTRISRGKVALQRRRVDLRDVVRKTADDLRSVFEQSHVDLVVELLAGPAWVDADETRVAQVVANLLQNAVKFTPDHGAVTVGVRTHAGLAEIVVRDDGAGMEPDQIERMFEPFAQADRSLARTRGGLGLGLALVRGLVELHGGTVRARSEGLGRGSEFTVALPLASAGAAARERPRWEGGAAGRLILIVEDNVDAGQSLADILELEGHRVRLARDGRSGIELARALRPDLVLCDIGLPDVDGYEVARALRRDDALRSTRLVALSGYAQPEDRRRALEAGFDAHVAKPLPLDELWKVIADAPAPRPPS